MATVKMGEKEQTVLLPQAKVGEKVVCTVKDKEGTWECTVQKEVMPARAPVTAIVVVKLGEPCAVQLVGIHRRNGCQRIRQSGNREVLVAPRLYGYP
jgi:hypothetical protein